MIFYVTLCLAFVSLVSGAAMTQTQLIFTGPCGTGTGQPFSGTPIVATGGQLFCIRSTVSTGGIATSSSVIVAATFALVNVETGTVAFVNSDFTQSGCTGGGCMHVTGSVIDDVIEYSFTPPVDCLRRRFLVSPSIDVTLDGPITPSPPDFVFQINPSATCSLE